MKIKVGIQLGVNNNQLESAERFWHIVDECERLGFDSLWLSERASGRVPDNLSAMAAIAGRTERLKFGSSVLVVPAYNPVLLATWAVWLASAMSAPSPLASRVMSNSVPAATPAMCNVSVTASKTSVRPCEIGTV